MTTLKIPPAWASNANYSTGPDNGTPTCVDPNSNANGFIRGVGAAAQHVNFLLNANSAALRRLLATQLTSLRYLQIETGTTVSDTAESMAAVSVSDSIGTLLVKTAQAFHVADQGRINATGVPASITSAVTDAASDGSRIVVVGTGGNRCTYSDSFGATWFAGADIGTSPVPNILWNAAHSRFIVLVSGAKLKYSSTAAAAWTQSAGTPIGVLGGLAQFSNGNVLGLNAGLTPNDFTLSVDGGANTTATGGSVPNAADFDDSGYVAGNAGSTVYHVGRKLVGTKMQISSSPDGVTWGLLKELDPPSGCTFSARARLLMCQQTGLIALAAPVTTPFSSSVLALYASVDGTNWVGPTFAYPSPGTAGVALANGRLFATRDDLFFGADGCGP